MEADVIALLHSLQPILFGTVVDKDKLQQKYGLNAHNPKRLALRSIVQRFDMTLQRLNAYGTVVMDEEQYRKDADLRKMIHMARRFGLSIRGMLYSPRSSTKPTRINGTVTFVPSEMSSGIQLADVVSGTTWRLYEKGDRTRFNRIASLFDRTGSRRWEPSLVPL
jgi:hypothetical protein